MGVTPYFVNKAKKLTKDSSHVARVKAAEQEDLCDVVRNCSVFFQPPAGHSLLVTALAVDNGNDIGSLSVHIDNNPVWHWDDDNEFNKSLDFSQHSEVDGAVGIAVTVRTVTTVWRNFKVNIILTAFKSKESSFCMRLIDCFSFIQMSMRLKAGAGMDSTSTVATVTASEEHTNAMASTIVATEEMRPFVDWMVFQLGCLLLESSSVCLF